jgi:putative phosphoribosyl transferase
MPAAPAVWEVVQAMLLNLWTMPLETKFKDRRTAGRFLAEKLRTLSDAPQTIVLALPRGGVPVGFEIARELGIPLDVLIVRKLGVPGHEELALGAIASDGITILNEKVIQHLNLASATIDRVVAAEAQELARREQEYRPGRPAHHLAGQTVILVDDGLATGATMRAAVQAVRSQHAARIIVAVPVGAPDTCARLRTEADDVVCGLQPAQFEAVGAWYDDFRQTTDAEVRDLLAAAVHHHEAP